jgi:hypothetical protein
MGLFDIIGKVAGAAAGAVKGVAEVVPVAVTTVTTSVSKGVANPPTIPTLPSIGAAITGASTTPHPAGTGQTVLEHYVAHYGGAVLAMVTAAIVPHLPIPAGLKTAGSAMLVGFALKALHDQAAHLETPYAGAPA